MATTSARVRCPHCGKSFKIPDRSLLGRTGKCSACAQKFTLTEEATAPASEAAPQTGKPAPAAAGRKAERRTTEKTPERPPEKAAPDVRPATPKPAASPAAERPPVERPAAASAAPTEASKKAPTRRAESAARTTAGSSPAALETIPWGLNAIWIADDSPAPAESSGPFAPSPFDSGPFAGSDDAEPAATAASSRPRKPVTAAAEVAHGGGSRVRRSSRRNALLGVGAAVVLIGGGLAGFALSRGPAAETGTQPPSNPATAPVAANPAVYSREMLKGNLALMEEFRPTQGRPIGMQYVPNGVNMVVHLRPADLWSSDRSAAELRASLTEGVTTWLDGRIRELCRREPARVSEATFAFVMGAFGTEPTSTQVVRLATPDKMSALLDEFSGKPLRDDLKPPVTVSDRLAFVLVDASTFSVSPAETADELEEALSVPNSYVSRNVAELLRETDRDRLLTVVAEMQDLRRHVDTLFPEASRPTIRAIVDWLGDDVDAIAWSIHTTPALYSELTLRPRAGLTSRALELSIQKKLDELPAQMMTLVKGTQPASKGFRELVGRYPAMLEAVRQSTILRPGSKDLYATTLLPAKAAPNLALGTLLTWDELRKSPGAAAPTAVASTAQPTEKVADRLKKEILAEFSRTPLEQAIKYIGDETGVDFSVDGEALRMMGYTRNMPQTMSLGKVPATQALKEILAVPNQKDLAVFVDEGANKAVLSTLPALTQQGKTPFKVD